MPLGTLGSLLCVVVIPTGDSYSWPLCSFKKSILARLKQAGYSRSFRTDWRADTLFHME